MLKPRGMTPAQFDSFIRACFYAKINPEKTSEGTRRVVQTIGNAPASAGYHAQDGTVTSNGTKIPYCAAADFSVRGLTAAQIKKWLQELARQGWCGWYRFEGSFKNNRHVHAVFVGVHMKPQLVAQVIDFLNDRNGLVGHAHETFYTAPTELDRPLAHAFVRANPSAKKRVPSYLLEDD